MPGDPSLRRIAIIGATGAGKTILARRLAAIVAIPLVHADSYIWGPNWTLRDRARAEAELRSILRAQADWIAEGYLNYAAREMLELADLVIYLDYSQPRLLLNNI